MPRIYYQLRRLWRRYRGRNVGMAFIQWQLVVVASVLVLLILKVPGWAVQLCIYVAFAAFAIIFWGPRDRA